VKFRPKVPAAGREGSAAVSRYLRDLRRAAIVATEVTSKGAQKSVQARIRSVGLGRLSNAVAQTSSAREKDFRNGDKPYGVLFARGGDETLAGGALESYSRGATITASGGKRWLAFATAAVPKFISAGGRRFRTTPELYRNSSLETSIGKLVFRQISDNRAVLIIRKVTLSPKTGRAKADTGRATRTRVREKEVVAFVLIRVTRRAQRFDKDQIVGQWARKVPYEMSKALAEIQRKRA
jgi:hypothetical protein